MRIIQRIDQGGDEEIDIVRLENASAAEIVRVVNALYQRAGTAGRKRLRRAHKLVADDRTNSVLISGEKTQRLRLKALITHLDTPLEAGGDTQVRYLNYADAEAIAGKLKEQVTGITGRPAARRTRRPCSGGRRQRPIAASPSGRTPRPTPWSSPRRRKSMRSIMVGGRQARHPSPAGAGRSDSGRDLRATRPPSSA